MQTMPMTMWCIFLLLVMTVALGVRSRVTACWRWRDLNLRVACDGGITITLDAHADAVKFGTTTPDGTFRYLRPDLFRF